MIGFVVAVIYTASVVSSVYTDGCQFINWLQTFTWSLTCLNICLYSRIIDVKAFRTWQRMVTRVHVLQLQVAYANWPLPGNTHSWLWVNHYLNLGYKYKIDCQTPQELNNKEVVHALSVLEIVSENCFSQLTQFLLAHNTIAYLNSVMVSMTVWSINCRTTLLKLVTLHNYERMMLESWIETDVQLWTQGTLSNFKSVAGKWPFCKS